MVDEQLKIRSPKPFSIGFADFKIELKKGEYAVPLFQRNFVWTPSKICKLMDSIYRYYPIGSFLIWKTKEKSLFKKSEDFIGYENHDYIKYILDGQQRMISLSIFLFGKLVTPIKKKHHLEPNNFCLDMRKVLQKEDSVFVYMDEKPDEIRYFSLYKILNEEYINDYGDLEIELDEKKIEEAYSDKTVDKNEIKKNLINCQKHFENYKFSIIEIDDSEIPSQKNRAKYIERMCDSFIRVNNQGTKLTTVNLVMASLFDENFNLQEEFSKFKKSLGSNFSDIPDEVILQTIALLLKNNISKSTMLNLKSREIKDEWENIKKSFKQALDKLETKFKVKNIKFLPYPIMVSILSGFYFSSKFNDFLPEQKKLLERWFWKSSFSGRFSGRGFFDNIISDKKKFDTLGKIT
ncbi:MAG: DUF262 domain-containing protein, partial [Nanoarchaeota archaeon]|nr:DUF262 domain-containing protein [Nanoarchaeota archaeon]